MEATKNTNGESQVKTQTRKPFKHRGRTQKMMSFRVDNDNAEQLAKEPNKGRLINNLLRRHYDTHA